MIVPYQADGGSIANLADDFDARTCFADTEAIPRKNLPITLGMEFGESLGELEFATVNGQRTIRALLPLDGILRKAIGIDAQEIADAGLLEAQKACHPVEAHHMDDVLLHRTENPLEHVIKMYTDVGGNAAALVDISLPGGIIPFAPGGDVREIHVIYLVRRAFIHLLLEGDDGLMQTELEDVVGFMTRLLLYLFQRVDVVGIQNHRLLADDIAAQAKAVADEGIMRVIGRTDAHPVQRIVALFLLGAIAVKELMLREERTLREETVQTADAVELVISRQEVVSGILDCF